VFAPWLPDALLPRSSPSPWLGFLGSFYGGIAEELLLRLGLMTLLVWVGTKITRSKHFSSAVIWIAIALTALLFGALHLPTTAQLVPLTAIVVTRALLLNGIPGLLFGWLYWRKGLEAAMVAHFSCDIVLHVIAVALSV
jgi:membrane protease YdiL (CAAX protease family)